MITGTIDRRALSPLVLIGLFLAAVPPAGAQSPSAASSPRSACVMPPPPDELRPGTEARRARAARPTLTALSPAPAPSPSLAIGTGGYPAILIDFADLAAVTPDTAIARRFFATGSGSVRDFYLENSYGQFDFDGEVTGWITSARTHDYYTNESWGLDAGARGFPYDPNVWGLMMEMLPIADASIDFSQFDGDEDGVVDGIFLVLAGRGAEETGDSTDFWSHKFDLRQCLTSPGCYPFNGNGFVTDDGVVIGPYVIVPERGQIGVAAHEFGHILGLPDLYITSSNPGESGTGVGVFCLMDSGAWMRASGTDPPGSLPSHYCGWAKYTLGWIDPLAVSADARTLFRQDISLPPVAGATAADPGVLRILDNAGGPDWSGGSGSGRYFLVENRQNLGFDRGLFAYSQMAGRREAGGLLITFVDESRPGNTLDLPGSLVMVVQADGEGFDAGGIPHAGEATDLWPGLPETPGGDTVTVFNRETVVTHDAFDEELAQVLLERLAVSPGGSAMLDALVFSDIADDPYAYPNPAYGDVPVCINYLPGAATPSTVHLRIFTLAGALVRTLEFHPVGLGECPAEWDLRNESGTPVASGLYVYVVEVDNHVGRGTVAVQR